MVHPLLPKVRLTSTKAIKMCLIFGICLGRYYSTDALVAKIPRLGFAIEMTLDWRRCYNSCVMTQSQAYLQQLLRGVVEPLMLYIIGELPTHGYRIARELDKRSNGYFRLAGSTVYSALRRLEKEGLVLSSWQGVARKQQRRYYRLTEKGYQILAEKLTEWQSFCIAADAVMNTR